MSKPKPLPVDNFKVKYNKPGNIFLNIDASVPYEHPLRKGAVGGFQIVKLQMVLLKNGKAVFRVVG